MENSKSKLDKGVHQPVKKPIRINQIKIFKHIQTDVKCKQLINELKSKLEHLLNSRESVSDLLNKPQVSTSSIRVFSPNPNFRNTS